jgi:hypothetical protein
MVFNANSTDIRKIKTCSKGRPMRASILLSAIATLSLTMPTHAFAYQDTAPESVAPEFAKFKPNPKSQLKIDYAYFDDILNNLVFLTGVSTRQIAPEPAPITGSRFIWEHTSPLRQEGNKIPFSKLRPEHILTLQEYKRDLENLSTTTNIASLSKREQLAYWLNLHNVTVIMLIAENYPIREPSKLLIGPGKVPMHDAKVISVNGSKLSLRDIRENIVYPNWQDAKVMYGFFLGDIGSPSLQGEAYTAANTEKLLNQNADEFVNSLRSFTRGGVSKIYQEAARFYFPNFEQNLREHFQLYMWDDVYDELSQTAKLKINNYDYDVADMEGGRGSGVIGNVTINGKPVRDAQSYAIASYTNQINEKSKVLLRQGKLKRGVVTVGDEEDEEAAEKKAEAEKPAESGNN